MGVPMIKVLFFGVYIRASDFWRLPNIHIRFIYIYTHVNMCPSWPGASGSAEAESEIESWRGGP